MCLTSCLLCSVAARAGKHQAACRVPQLSERLHEHHACTGVPWDSCHAGGTNKRNGGDCQPIHAAGGCSSGVSSLLGVRSSWIGPRGRKQLTASAASAVAGACSCSSWFSSHICTNTCVVGLGALCAMHATALGGLLINMECEGD